MTLKKRLLALCMAVVMVFSLCSISAFAAAPTDDKQPVVIGRYDAPLSECLEPGMAMQVGIANVRVICEPESGTIEYILDGSNAGYYAIFYNNISEEEIQKYIDQLKTLGYAEEASASESVSTGVLLRKDETWISIAYSEGGFGIRISVEKS